MTTVTKVKARANNWKKFLELKVRIWAACPEGKKESFTSQERAQIYRDVLLCLVNRGEGCKEAARERLANQSIPLNSI